MDLDDHHLPDAEIIKLYRKTGDPEWVGVLFERYTHLVFGICLKYLKDQENSKDAVMSIFENLLEDLLIHDIKNFKSWLYTVSKNFCLMKLRKLKIVHYIEETTEKKMNSSFVEFMQELHLNNEQEQNRLFDKLQEAIGQLKPEQGKCIKLLYLHEKSYKEVAEITGYNLKKVKSYIQNGKRNLRRLLN
jgi:RNA polymerase sigma factor (sigma-70 family)